MKTPVPVEIRNKNPGRRTAIVDFDEEPNQEKRIEKLRLDLEKLGGGGSQHPELPADLEEEFLKHTLAFETTEPSSLLDWLENAGMEVPAPDQLNDAQLSPKLWEVINRMASLGAYLHNTNHLSDRELYSYLFEEGLREDAVLFPEKPELCLRSRSLGQRQRRRHSPLHEVLRGRTISEAVGN